VSRYPDDFSFLPPLFIFLSLNLRYACFAEDKYYQQFTNIQNDTQRECYVNGSPEQNCHTLVYAWVRWDVFPVLANGNEQLNC
jgi:hypothetical protein